MIKKILLAILVAFPMIAVAQSPKFGIVNTQTIIQDLPDFKEAREQIDSSSKKYEDEFKKLQEQMEKSYAEFQALAADTPESIKERRMQEIQDLDQKIQQFRQTASQELQKQSETLMAPIRQKVFTAIQSVGTEGGYTFIFENTVPIFSGQDVKDITSEHI